MSEEIYAHQFIYIPWTATGSHSKASVAATQLIAAKHGLSITVAAATLHNVPNELSRAAKVTERSGSVKPGGVVLAYYPTYKLMSKLDQLANSIVVLAEFHTDDHSGWAKSVGAYNVSTGKVMSDGLSEDAHEAIRDLLFAGYKGWHDSIAVSEAMRALDDLAKAGGYDRQVVLFKARQERDEDGIQNLYAILDKFEKSLV